MGFWIIPDQEVTVFVSVVYFFCYKLNFFCVFLVIFYVKCYFYILFLCKLSLWLKTKNSQRWILMNQCISWTLFHENLKQHTVSYCEHPQVKLLVANCPSVWLHNTNLSTWTCPWPVLWLQTFPGQLNPDKGYFLYKAQLIFTVAPIIRFVCILKAAMLLTCWTWTKELIRVTWKNHNWVKMSFFFICIISILA